MEKNNYQYKNFKKGGYGLLEGVTKYIDVSYLGVKEQT